MSRNQRTKSKKYTLRDKRKKSGRWSGTRKGRSSKKDKEKSKEKREWYY